MKALESKEARQLLIENQHFVETILALEDQLNNAREVALNWQDLYHNEREQRKYWHKVAKNRRILTVKLVAGIMVASFIMGGWLI